ncbi:unnamed protein product [Schistosoma margrebowiei]|uniref:Uncharacterized protein n=1 Tax=Schistosoma margrebowiei TaxID=48269 RepID=A0AA85A148_9TREM|nr:unnamed protein product [Schistosoma margrebowiei]
MTMKQGKSVFVSSKFRMLKRTHTMHVGYTGPMNEPSKFIHLACECIWWRPVFDMIPKLSILFILITVTR